MMICSTTFKKKQNPYYNWEDKSKSVVQSCSSATPKSKIFFSELGFQFPTHDFFQMSHLKMTINARKSWKLMTAHSHAKTVANIIPKNLVIYIVLCISSDSGHLERGILNVFSNSFHPFQNNNTSSQWTMSCRSSSYTARFLECSKNQKYQKIKFITLTYY